MIGLAGGASRRRAGRRVAIIIGAGALLLLAQLSGLHTPLGGLVSWLTRPVGQSLSSLGSGGAGFLSTVGNLQNLSADNAKLRRENAELKLRLAEDAELRQQNEALRKQISFGEAQPRKLIPAEIIGYQPDNFRQFLTIGRGSRDGVAVGQAVISEGSLVGKISEVSPATAKVFLVSDPDFRTNGLDQETRATGTVRGQLGAGFVMDKIAQNETIKPGDTIITSGLGGELPKGLIIGRVQSVEQQDNAVFQVAQIASDLKFNQLELIFVVQQ